MAGEESRAAVGVATESSLTASGRKTGPYTSLTHCSVDSLEASLPDISARPASVSEQPDQHGSQVRVEVCFHLLQVAPAVGWYPHVETLVASIAFALAI